VVKLLILQLPSFRKSFTDYDVNEAVQQFVNLLKNFDERSNEAFTIDLTMDVIAAMLEKISGMNILPQVTSFKGADSSLRDMSARCASRTAP